MQLTLCTVRHLQGEPQTDRKNKLGHYIAMYSPIARSSSFEKKSHTGTVMQCFHSYTLGK